uniref:Haem-binding domain-containing protein n=1 Tax=Roseihalotalea indica TaxID=2867963 RepID=A0AA49PYY7_9BACT|nr:hypothetical protein K4G66_14665 [Tunicatimonas sp. TK19036]
MRHSITRLLKPILLCYGLAGIPALRAAEQPTMERGEPFHLKQAALEVLQTKCNVCHKKKNPRRVFTLDNMSDLAPRIYKQVFVKQRMPKGKETQLTREEYNTLEKWLLTENLL